MKIYDPNTQNINKKTQFQMEKHISDAQIFKKVIFWKILLFSLVTMATKSQGWFLKSWGSSTECIFHIKD